MDEFSIILQAKLSEADCMEITHLLNEAYHRGRADAITECVEIIARLVANEMIDLSVYEMVKAELTEKEK